MMASGRIAPYCKQLDVVQRVLYSSPSPLAVSSSHVSELSTLLHQTRLLSQQSPQRPQSFIGKLVDNIKQEYEKNREMKESLEKFRQEAEKLEQSDALRKAREKYERLESETGETSKMMQDRIINLKKRLGEAMDEAQKLEMIKKATELTQALNRQARQSAEAVAQKGEQLGKSATFRSIQDKAKAVQDEIDDSTIGTPGVYRAPAQLRMRKQPASGSDGTMGAPPIAADNQTTGVELHKDSKFYANWQNFKDNNAYVNKVLDWKMRYDESENPVARASKLLTEKVSDLMGGLFQRTELSEVLTEICKMDPAFDKDAFLRDCERDLIPNILEAMMRGDLAVLRDWCYEATYQMLSQPVLAAQQLGMHYDNRVLDIDTVDLAMGKMMDQGPVLIITFTSQQIHCVRNSKGEVVEGDPEKIMRVHYVWVLCRDQTELDPRAAWRLLELSASSREQLV